MTEGRPRIGDLLVRAKRLMHDLAPRLTHGSFYHNHVDRSALALRSYSREPPGYRPESLHRSSLAAAPSV